MNSFSKLSELILNLNPFEFTAISIILGYIFSENLDSNQVQSLGNFFESIGQTMLTIGMQMQNLQGGYQDNDILSNYPSLKDKIESIESIIKNFKVQ